MSRPPKTYKSKPRFFEIDASECDALKIQPFITLIQFIKYDRSNGTKIIVRHENNEFNIYVNPEFAKAMAYTIADVIDKLSGKECTIIKEVDRW